MPPPTTLILGAGSSCTYGYPTGMVLRAKILDLVHHVEEFSDQSMIGRTELRRFFEAFRLSSQRSIDRFLAQNGRYEHAGKAAIARVLFECEKADDLFAEGIKDNWYSYIVNLISESDWNHLDLSWLTIVTFNYDRSLEHFLMVALTNTYGKGEAEVIERMATLKVMNVYGSLGKPWAGDVPRYGEASADAEHMGFAVNSAVGRLRVIAEGRNDDEHLTPIREAILASERLAFLGFSFDKTNVDRLGGPQVYGTYDKPKRVAATTYGLTDAEVMRIKGWMFGGDNTPQARISMFRPMHCEALLHETLILE